MNNNPSFSRSAAAARITCFLGLAISIAPAVVLGAEHFEGQFYRGEGDAEYLQLLDISRRMFEPDPEFQNMAMFYMPAWNGLVEGPTWDAWWIQNSYGPTYCALPFWQEPFLRFLQNSQDLWFDQMGDGKTPRPFSNFAWVPPDGCLCDAARPGWFIAKQGDGRVDIHDWCMEFTAAGVVMQAELLLMSSRREGHPALPAQAGAIGQFHRKPPRSEEQPLPGRARPATCWPPAMPAGRGPAASSSPPTWPAFPSPISPAWTA